MNSMAIQMSKFSKSSQVGKKKSPHRSYFISFIINVFKNVYQKHLLVVIFPKEEMANFD